MRHDGTENLWALIETLRRLHSTLRGKAGALQSQANNGAGLAQLAGGGLVNQAWGLFAGGWKMSPSPCQ